MIDPDDDLTAALRRELAGATVPRDDDRANAMIRLATAAEPLATRTTWAAPLAAAAAVVVVGGGAAVIAASRNGSGSPSGGGPVGCPTVSSSATPVPSTTAAIAPSDVPTPTESGRTPVQVQTLAPSTSPTPTEPTPTEPTTAEPTPTTPIPSASPSTSSPPEPATTAPTSADPCAAPPETPNPSAVYPVTPTPSASTSNARPSADVEPPNSSITTPYNDPPRTAASGSSPGQTRFDLIAQPGETTEQVTSLPFGGRESIAGARLVRVSGASGSIAIYRGSVVTAMNDNLGSFVDETITPETPVIFTPQAPMSVRLTCTGTTMCSVRVTLDPAAPAGEPAATTTPSR